MIWKTYFSSILMQHYSSCRNKKYFIEELYTKKNVVILFSTWKKFFHYLYGCINEITFLEIPVKNFFSSIIQFHADCINSASKNILSHYTPYKYIPLEILDYDEDINDILKIEISWFVIVLIVFCLPPKKRLLC